MEKHENVNSIKTQITNFTLLCKYIAN